ncbi:Hexaprenyldihydroxybenzoate methyltransferase, mitochondrial [Haplosporangium sp. Z 11]|nr:Hexaprenyldihydroxybenzoate methyltransferase, mitochondrial [Haplosporangium sp. Z 11]
MARMGARISSTSLTAPLARTIRTSPSWISRWSHDSHRNQVALDIMTKQRACFSTAITTYHANHSSAASNGIQQSSSDSLIDTVNKDEIAKFSAMSDEWWAPQGPFKMLHLMNPPRIRYIRNRLEASGAISRSMGQGDDISRGRFPLQGLRILDVGCGGGLLAEALARLGAHVTGLDASIENIQMARIHAKKDPLLNGGAPGSLEYRHQTAEQLLEQEFEFDVVCSMEVIEHVENPAGFLKVLGQLLKHLMRMVPVGTHHWSKFINPEELRAGVQDLANCQVLNIQGIGFNPLSGQWELMRSRDGTTASDTGLLALLGSPMAETANYFLAAKKLSSP